MNFRRLFLTGVNNPRVPLVERGDNRAPQPIGIFERVNVNFPAVVGAPGFPSYKQLEKPIEYNGGSQLLTPPRFSGWTGTAQEISSEIPTPRGVTRGGFRNVF